MNAMDEKVEFLTARLDEDERFAKRATEGPWTVDIHGNRYSIRSPWRQMIDDGGNEVRGGRTNNEVAAGFTYVDGAHDNVYFIARFDSARALAEIAAKRALLALGDGYLDDMAYAMHEQTVSALIQVYAAHPDFQESWKA